MQRQLDEELLEIESKIEEVLSLMREKNIDENLEKARLQLEKCNGDRSTGYFLESKKGVVTTTMHTNAHLALGNILKKKIRLCHYRESLEDTLSRLSEQRVAVLERILGGHSSEGE